MRRSILTLATITSAALWASLPGANPVNWQLLEAISFEEVEQDGRWQVIKDFPEALTANTQDFTITGYYVPVEAQAYVTQFLLVPDPADCPFCGSSGYGFALEVRMREAMPDVDEATEVTVTGTLELLEDTDTYQFARLTRATLVSAGN